MRLRIALLTAVAALMAAGCGSDSSPMPAPSGNTSGTPVSIVRGALSLTTTAYSPNPLVVNAGTTVTWTNNDTTGHTSTASDGSWNSGTIAPGASFSRTFTTPGSFNYLCTIHPNMVGTVNVQ